MKNEEKRKKVITEHINVDCGRLYGTIDEAIAYLQEVKIQHGAKTNFGLEEHWFGYEDMEMVFSFEREETDAEFENRLRDEAAREKYARQQKAEEKRREEQLKQYHKLRDQLGMRY